MIKASNGIKNNHNEYFRNRNFDAFIIWEKRVKVIDCNIY